MSGRNKIVLFDTETTGFPKMPIDTQPDDVQPYVIELSAFLIEHDRQEYDVVDSFTTKIAGTCS